MHSNHQYNKKLRPLAKALRQNMTKAEVKLWSEVLRAKQMKGYTFRRQRPIGDFIVDFVCLELRLVVEVDGLTHDFVTIQAKDELKERYLLEKGFIVLRFNDDDVLNDIDFVERTIVQEIEKLEFPPPAPPPKGE